MPEENNGILKYKKSQKSMRIPFLIFSVIFACKKKMLVKMVLKKKKICNGSKKT